MGLTDKQNMGRAFEFRKARKFKRWGHMARTFTKIGKEISIAVKASGPDPSGNPRLRALIATAKTENMPKDNIDRAIKKAMEKDSSEYKEIVYAGTGPFGIAILVETATDNTTVPWVISATTLATMVVKWATREVWTICLNIVVNSASKQKRV